MEMRIQNTCEELYWETAKKAVVDCKMVAIEALRLCRSVFRFDEQDALEKKYGDLFAPYGEGDIGKKILDRMVALSIPAYGNDLHAIEDSLDDPYHAELNAYYYFKTGRVLAEDYTLPAFDWENYHEIRDLDGAKGIAMWTAHEEAKRAFYLAIAEKLWDFSSFTTQYNEVLSKEKIEEYHEYCRKIFIEERIFLQPEWMLFSFAGWQGKTSFLYENPCVDFFLRAHKEALSLLPDEVLKCKAVKEAIAKKYKRKY